MKRTVKHPAYLGVICAAFPNLVSDEGTPFPDSQFIQIYSSKFKLDSVCHMSQTSIPCVTHTVLFLRIGKYTLNLLFLPRVQFLVHCHHHKILLDKAQECFLSLGVFGHITLVGQFCQR